MNDVSEHLFRDIGLVLIIVKWFIYVKDSGFRISMFRLSMPDMSHVNVRVFEAKSRVRCHVGYANFDFTIKIQFKM